MDVAKIIKEQKGTVVDVRTAGEFMSGHVPGSINIPLMEIPRRMAEIRRLPQPLVLCCASGNRSAQAQAYISEEGIECYNGGSWVSVNYYRA